MRRLVLPLALLLLLLLLPAHALAATGDLSFKDCVAKFAIGSCTGLPNQEILEGGRDVAVSPDGKYVFVADGQDGVVGFTRNGTTGAVTYASCFDSGGGAPCTHAPKNLFLQPRSIAISPDGGTLFVAAETSDTIVRLKVGAGGALSFDGCVEDDDLPDWECGTEVASLEDPTTVVLSPDGNSLYATSGGATLSHFGANLSLLNCYREVVITGCATQAEPLSAGRGLAFSPSGANLYVTSIGRDAIAWFKRESNGSLTFVGCIADGDDATAFTDNCVEDSAANYDFMNHITVSPNGEHAYVTDETGLGVVYHFTRDGTTGTLTRQDCLADDLNLDAPGCAELDDATGSGLASVTDAVVSPDNANLYAVAGQDSALSTFGLLASPAGKLSFIRCLRANEVQGCTGFGTSSALSQPLGVAISPDGHDVYVANNSGGVPALLHFEREAPGSRSGGSEEPGGEEPGPDPGSGGGGTGTGTGQTPGTGSGDKQPTPKCNGLAATILGTAGKDNLRGTKKKDVIAAGAGNDKVDALAGKDVVCGEGGNDKLGGGPDADVLLGGPGKDLLKGAGGPDKMLGGPGADTLLGGPGRDKAKQ
ncbi:MAG TPA: beta-propeller fold lactonase family protein [Solirubrobacterales bacterium]|nr:beta-propeller fold lactonase family protein [Solirubrobacterales bacterium]